MSRKKELKSKPAEDDDITFLEEVASDSPDSVFKMSQNKKTATKRCTQVPKETALLAQPAASTEPSIPPKEKGVKRVKRGNKDQQQVLEPCASTSITPTTVPENPGEISNRFREVAVGGGPELQVDYELLDSLIEFVSLCCTSSMEVFVHSSLPSALMEASKVLAAQVGHWKSDKREDEEQLPADQQIIINTFYCYVAGLSKEELEGEEQLVKDIRLGDACPQVLRYAGLVSVLLRMSSGCNENIVPKVRTVGNLVTSEMIRLMGFRYSVEEMNQWINATTEESGGGSQSLEYRLVHVGRLLGSLIKTFRVEVLVIGELISRVGSDPLVYPLLYGMLTPNYCECLGYVPGVSKFEHLALWVRGVLLAVFCSEMGATLKWKQDLINLLNEYGIAEGAFVPSRDTENGKIEVWVRDQLLPEMLREGKGASVMAMMFCILGREWIRDFGVVLAGETIKSVNGSTNGKEAVVNGISLAISRTKKKRFPLDTLADGADGDATMETGTRQAASNEQDNVKPDTKSSLVKKPTMTETVIDGAAILKMNSCALEDISGRGDTKVDSVEVPAHCLGDSECAVGSAKKKEAVELGEMLWCKRLLDELFCHEDFQAFMLPVDAKLLPTYGKVVETSMDLKKIQAQLAASKYKCGKDFLDDVMLNFENSEKLYAVNDPTRKAASRLKAFVLNHELVVSFCTAQEAQEKHLNKLKRGIEENASGKVAEAGGEHKRAKAADIFIPEKKAVISKKSYKKNSRPKPLSRKKSRIPSQTEASAPHFTDHENLPDGMDAAEVIDARQTNEKQTAESETQNVNTFPHVAVCTSKFGPNGNFEESGKQNENDGRNTPLQTEKGRLTETPPVAIRQDTSNTDNQLACPGTSCTNLLAAQDDSTDFSAQLDMVLTQILNPDT